MAAHGIVFAAGALVPVDGDPRDVLFPDLRAAFSYDEWFHRRTAFAARLGAMGAMFDAIDWRWPR